MAAVQGRRRTAAGETDTWIGRRRKRGKGVEEEELGVEVVGRAGRPAGRQVDSEDQ